ncbi:putative metallocarboxypeptidase ecm14 [Rhexocercosporidium sp. MPI-PUGE-AT-0058]|nr:putative metallocarboxypeptidase ecm14 [Rhexocercosporidium sp. MPI-PUGE-AT-0058]
MTAMQRSIPSFTLVVGLLVCVGPFAAAFAVPWTTDNNQFSTTQRQHAAEHQSYKSHSIFPISTWLRDIAIQKLFGLPPTVTQPGIEKPTSSAPITSQLPATLRAKYGGDVVLRFNLSSAAEETALAQAADTLFLDVWEFTNNWADIRLREDDLPSLLGLLPKSLQTGYSNLMPDLASTIYQSYPSLAFSEPEPPLIRSDRSFTPNLRASDGVDNIFFQDYQPFSVLVPWMRLMASMFTTHVRMISIGTSYEGRDIPALRVGVSPNLPQENDDKRKTIIISGGSHAREWISVSTVTYIAWSLITSYGKSPGITKLLQEFDFVFIPTVNPDGYVYTWENDRLWRKNRQQTNLRFCRGLDLDRTFGFEWDGTTYQSNPCSESYPGDEPFQAVESHRFAEWAKNETANNGVKFVGFLDLHSYSQQVLYPYSYSCNADPPSLENLEELGMGLAKAIRISSGEQYSVASACEGAVSSKKVKGAGEMSRMETGGGSAIDWFYHEMGVRYSYQIKLRDTGSYGFLLPKDNIVPTGEEAFNAVKYFGDFLLGNKGIESTLFPESYQAMQDSEGEDSGQIVAVEDEVEDYNWELRRRR